MSIETELSLLAAPIPSEASDALKVFFGSELDNTLLSDGKMLDPITTSIVTSYPLAL